MNPKYKVLVSSLNWITINHFHSSTNTHLFISERPFDLFPLHFMLDHHKGLVPFLVFVGCAGMRIHFLMIFSKLLPSFPASLNKRKSSVNLTGILMEKNKYCKLTFYENIIAANISSCKSTFHSILHLKWFCNDSLLVKNKSLVNQFNVNAKIIKWRIKFIVNRNGEFKFYAQTGCCFKLLETGPEFVVGLFFWNLHHYSPWLLTIGCPCHGLFSCKHSL